MSSIENNRGRIRKPIAPEVVKYINDPVAKSDYETSYFTYLTINRAHVLMLEKQGIIAALREKGAKDGDTVIMAGFEFEFVE